MQNFFDKVNAAFASIPGFLQGLIYLGFAVLIGWLLKIIVVAVLNKVGFGKKLSNIKTSDDGKGEGIHINEIIGKLVFVVVFMLFVPTILDKFGMQAITAPILNLINAFVSYIPNVVACVVILFIGFFIAKTVKQLIVAAIALTKVEKLQEKISGGKSTFNIAKLVGTVAYIFIAAITVICSLNVLNIDAISVPTTNMLDKIIVSVPLIIVALIVLFVGFFLGKLASSFLSSILASFGLDEKCNKWLGSDNKEVKPVNIAKIIAGVVKAVIIILFTVEAINVLDFSILTNVGAAIIAFMPSMLVVVVCIILAYILGRVVESKVNIPGCKSAKKIIKAAIYIVGSFIGLSQLGIAPVIVNTAFVVAIVSAGVAFALAVGLGGRQFVQDTLASKKCCKKNDAAKEENTEDKKDAE